MLQHKRLPETGSHKQGSRVFRLTTKMKGDLKTNNEKELQMYSCAYVMDTALKSNPYIVERLIYPGLYILAGAPKITIHNLRISKIMHEKSK